MHWVFRRPEVEYFIFDYEQLLYDVLLSNNGGFKDKHLWVNKPTRIEITVFMLRIMAWLCTSKNAPYHCQARNVQQFCIVIGPSITITIELIKRMKAIFERMLWSRFQNKERILELDDCTVEALLCDHLGAERVLDNPKFILLD
jgi:hypothetical protein